MNTLGIYFGPQLISIVETSGKEPVKIIRVAQSMISPQAASEEKVPEEVKLATLLRDELDKNAIEAKDVAVSLSGRDLIIRTFEMTTIPNIELHHAVNFEIKKYIPFKTEDLISDFQWHLDKAIQKTRILFVGSKKETLEKYLRVLKQLGLRVNSIEYSAFSVLRLLKLAGIKEKGIVAVVNIEPTQEDEANFVVLENGFPLFSRDITFSAGLEGTTKTEEEQTAVILGKLGREIQISLDYYERKFPGKNIGKIFFITSPGYRSDLEAFFKESGLAIHFIDMDKITGKPVTFSLAFLKGYSSSLYKIDTGLKINLLLAKERAAKKTSIEQKGIASLLALARANTPLIIGGLCVCLAVFAFGIYRLLPVQRDLDNTLKMRPPVSIVSEKSNYEALVTENSSYKLKLAALDELIKKRPYLTPMLDSLPRLIPAGIWLTDLSFQDAEEKKELTLKGMAYLDDKDKESDLINKLAVALRADPVLNKYFEEINLVSTKAEKNKKTSLTSFIIFCQGNKKGQAKR